jgi:WD40 repeat protein
MLWFAFSLLVGTASYGHSRLGSGAVTTSVEAHNNWKENEATEPTNGASRHDLRRAFSGTGITSLLSIGHVNFAETPDGIQGLNVDVLHRMLIGTKRGDIAELAVDATGPGPVHCSILNWYSSSAATGTTRFPIYSLATSNDTIFAGSGDRYVSLWPLEQQIVAKNHPKGSWWGQKSIKQRLGPHTGWVKALAFDSDCLYSIGCNRIEKWTQSSVVAQRGINVDVPPRSTTEWSRAGSIVVNSCAAPNKACTLSSDLLCMATCRVVVVVDKDAQRQEQCSILAVGGVDGRIHWYNLTASNSGQTRPYDNIALATLAAHQGRVTALRFVPEEQILISASHDGTVQCWSLCCHDTKSSGICDLSVLCVASAALDTGTRITALDTCHSLPLQQQLQVLVGTNNGQVVAWCLQKCRPGLDKSFEFVEQRRWQMEPCLDDSIVQPQPPTIHAVCALSNQAFERSIVVVGHSHGIEFLRQE